MAERERLIYERAKKADKNIGPIGEFDFFPTKEDARLAKAGLAKYPSFATDHGSTASAFRLVATRSAVSLNYLEIVRNFEKDRRA